MAYAVMWQYYFPIERFPSDSVCLIDGANDLLNTWGLFFWSNIDFISSETFER